MTADSDSVSSVSVLSNQFRSRSPSPTDMPDVRLTRNQCGLLGVLTCAVYRRIAADIKIAFSSHRQSTRRHLPQHQKAATGVSIWTKSCGSRSGDQQALLAAEINLIALHIAMLYRVAYAGRFGIVRHGAPTSATCRGARQHAKKSRTTFALFVSNHREKAAIMFRSEDCWWANRDLPKHCFPLQLIQDQVFVMLLSRKRDWRQSLNTH